MKPTTNKKKADKSAKGKKAPLTDFIYANDMVKDFEFFDFVRVRAGQRGMLFSFGKGHPEAEKVIIFKEILIPLEVAYSLKEILINQFDDMQKSGFIKIGGMPKGRKDKNNV